MPMFLDWFFASDTSLQETGAQLHFSLFHWPDMNPDNGFVKGAELEDKVFMDGKQPARISQATPKGSRKPKKKKSKGSDRKRVNISKDQKGSDDKDAAKNLLSQQLYYRLHDPP